MRTSSVLLLLSSFLAAACDGPASDPASAEGERRPAGKADGAQQQVSGSCFSSYGDPLCGEQGVGSCWCDEWCAEYGDCCEDFALACGPEPEPSCNPEPLEVRDPVLSGEILWDHCEVHLILEKTIVDGDLTIAPGVRIFGDNPATPSSLLIRGSLDARGTQADPIVFQPGEGRHSWGGLTAGRYADALDLEFVELREPIRGLHVYGGQISATHVVIDGTGVGEGVVVSSTHPETAVSLSDVLVREFETGIAGGLGGSQSASAEVSIRDAVIADNERGIFLGTDHDYCLHPEVAKPVGRLEVEYSDLVGNGLAFGIGYNQRWARYRLDHVNIVGNEDIALIQAYESPAGSSVRNSNIVDNGGGLVTYRQLFGTTSFPYDYWGGLTEAEVLERATSACTGEPEEKISLGGLRTEPVEGAGFRADASWGPVCAAALAPC